MLSGVITNRYAKGLFLAAEDKKTADAVNESLQLLAQTLALYPEYKSILESPVIGVDGKLKAVDNVFGTQLQPLVRRFLELLFERGRSSYIGVIAERFQQLLDSAEGKLSVTVQIAQSLTEEEKKQLDAKLSHALNKEIHANVEVNSALLAGYRVRVGNRVLDATLLAALNQFGDKLRTTALASKAQG